MQDSGLPSFPVDEFCIIGGTTIPNWWSDCTQLIVIDRNWILVSSCFFKVSSVMSQSSGEQPAVSSRHLQADSCRSRDQSQWSLHGSQSFPRFWSGPLFRQNECLMCRTDQAQNFSKLNWQSHVARSAFPVGFISIDLKWLQLSHMCGKFTVPNWHLLL